MRDFLAFRTMLTPVLIQMIFWGGAALCVVVGLTLTLSGAAAASGGGGRVLTGLALLFLGPPGFAHLLRDSHHHLPHQPDPAGD